MEFDKLLQFTFKRRWLYNHRNHFQSFRFIPSKIEIVYALNGIYEICQAISSYNIELIHFSIFSKYKTTETFLWRYYAKLNI